MGKYCECGSESDGWRRVWCMMGYLFVSSLFKSKRSLHYAVWLEFVSMKTHTCSTDTDKTKNDLRVCSDSLKLVLDSFTDCHSCP